MRVPPAEYLQLALRAHDVLRGVPLHDVSAVDLPGGGEGRTIADVRALSRRDVARPGVVVRALFGLRAVVGRVLGWDCAPIADGDSWIGRLSDDDRRASEVVPGTPMGDFRVLYQFRREALAEIRNATVHAFLCIVLTQAAGGYRLYWAVYVLPVSWITRPYLAAIEPFRRLIVYPALLRRLQAAWRAAHPVASAG